MARLFKLLLLCAAITAACCYVAYIERGYFAFGGEWLVWMAIVVLAVSEEGEINGMD